MHTVLVAEDEPEIRNYLKLALGCQGFNVEFAQTGSDVIPLLSEKKDAFSLLLLDIFMPFQDGLEVLKEVRQLRPDLPVIMMSVAATPSNIVNAMREGAKDFLAKPIGHNDLRKSIEKALGLTVPANASATGDEACADGDYLASSGTWSQKIALLLERVGSSDVPVLLQGETGVGKEVIARKLHARSRRANRPFLKLNCAALPSELVESELFGYERGAFTGAFKNTPGKFEMANGGTIFLDEIGDMDFKLQAKLLQVIQDREFLRLGAKEVSRVDVRVMAASHCDFDKAIREGRFREDLFYRLNIIDIHIPPLRERPDEILPLAEFFLQKYATPDAPVLEIGPSLRQVLLDHPWPGNVRELENVMQKYLVLRNASILGEEIRKRARKGITVAVSELHPLSNLSEIPSRRDPMSIVSSPGEPETWSAGTFAQPFALEADFDPTCDGAAAHAVPITFRQVSTFESATPSPLSKVNHAHRAAEAEAILQALNSSLWNRKQAASLLNIDYKALLYKMKKLGIGEKRVASVG